MLVYLSGSCKNVSVEERDSWRNYIEESLIDGDIKVFNPNKKFSYDKNDPGNSKLVMDYFLQFVDRSDVVVVNLNNSDLSVGTGMEVMRAVDKGKFIIGFGDTNVYDYIRDCCSVVFADIDEVVDFVKSYFT